MRFFQDLNGNSRPVSAIMKIGKGREITYKPSGRKGTVYPVDLVGDQSCEISDFDRGCIMDAPVHFVPALPGTFILSPIGEAGDEDAPWQTPVIAWAHTAEGNIVPYTADGANDGLDFAGPILHPNGMIGEIGGAFWRNFDDFMTSQRADRDKKAAPTAE